jgi:hypothetical protein
MHGTSQDVKIVSSQTTMLTDVREQPTLFATNVDLWATGNIIANHENLETVLMSF